MTSGVRYSYGMRCVMGFDGGGTKTDCVLMDETGSILARTRSGPSNPVLVGINPAVAALVDAAEKAAAIGGATFAEVKILSGGVAGLGAARCSAEVIAELQAKFANAHVSLLSDLSMASAATGETPSVVVIAGTGSAVFGRNGAGETAREGGLGPILGDPGSAYDIGRKAVVEEWRRMPHGATSHLQNAILERFRCDWPQLQEKIRANSIGVLPQIFPLVTRAASEGDQGSQELLRSAGQELGALAAHVIARLRLSNEDFLLAKTGGVFNRSLFYDDPFDRSIRSAAPKARIAGLPTPVAEFAARSAIAVLSRSTQSIGS
jgi:N-acetylglucosamine kinase-like BadF-type ATPase